MLSRFCRAIVMQDSFKCNNAAANGAWRSAVDLPSTHVGQLDRAIAQVRLQTCLNIRIPCDHHMEELLWYYPYQVSLSQAITDIKVRFCTLFKIRDDFSLYQQSYPTILDNPLSLLKKCALMADRFPPPTALFRSIHRTPNYWLKLSRLDLISCKVHISKIFP